MWLQRFWDWVCRTKSGTISEISSVILELYGSKFSQNSICEGLKLWKENKYSIFAVIAPFWLKEDCDYLYCCLLICVLFSAVCLILLQCLELAVSPLLSALWQTIVCVQHTQFHPSSDECLCLYLWANCLPFKSDQSYLKSLFTGHRKAGQTL